MSRVTPHGFWRRAKEFLAAADAAKPVPAKQAPTEQPSMVAYYLVGHSIELSLKSFLYAKNYTLKELRDPRNFGHNLYSLLNECRKRKLGREAKLTSYEVQAIALLSDTYKSKKFEYLEYGYYRLPEYYFIRDVAKKLVDELRRYAMNPPIKVLKRTVKSGTVLALRSTTDRH